MRMAGKREFNPAAVSQANYVALHNGANLNVAMQIARAAFLWIRKPAMLGRIRGYYAREALYLSSRRRWEGNTLCSGRGNGGSSWRNTKRSQVDNWKDSAILFSFFPLRKKTQSIMQRQSCYDNLCIQIESSAIDNYCRRAHRDLPTRTENWRENVHR